jgi:hypothetical protein
MGHHARLRASFLTMANHPGVCTNPVDCDCWHMAAQLKHLKSALITRERMTLDTAVARMQADSVTTDLTRHEHCLEQGWTHHSKETT